MKCPFAERDDLDSKAIERAVRSLFGIVTAGRSRHYLRPTRGAMMQEADDARGPERRPQGLRPRRVSRTVSELE